MRNCQKNFGTAIFGHSEFIPVFLRNIVGKNLEWPFCPFQIYTSFFGENCWEKFGTAIFGHSKFIPVFWEKLSEKIQNSHFWSLQPVFLGKLVGKNLEWPFLAILNLYQCFWEKIARKNLKWPFLAILIFF